MVLRIAVPHALNEGTLRSGRRSGGAIVTTLPKRMHTDGERGGGEKEKEEEGLWDGYGMDGNGKQRPPISGTGMSSSRSEIAVTRAALVRFGLATGGGGSGWPS